MPIVRDPELDRLTKAHDAAWKAKLIADKRYVGFKAVVNTIRLRLKDSRSDYEDEVRELSDEVGRLRKESDQNKRNGAPKRAVKSKRDEADVLLDRRNMLVGQRDIIRSLLRSACSSLESAEQSRDECRRDWQVAHAELEDYKLRHRLHPRKVMALMDDAGLPVAYQRDALIKRDRNKIHIYFGGIGSGVGPGHGHFVFDSTLGRNIYRRMPTTEKD